MWDLVAAALPIALSADPLPYRLADLLELGVELAQTCHPRAELTCLDPLAAKRGSTQLITQARRLRDATRRTT